MTEICVSAGGWICFGLIPGMLRLVKAVTENCSHVDESSWLERIPGIPRLLGIYCT